MLLQMATSGHTWVNRIKQPYGYILLCSPLQISDRRPWLDLASGQKGSNTSYGLLQGQYVPNLAHSADDVSFSATMKQAQGVGPQVAWSALDPNSPRSGRALLFASGKRCPIVRYQYINSHIYHQHVEWEEKGRKEEPDN